MAEVVLFHHALGLTPGVLAFADDLRAAGHVVHTPDLFAGKTFDDLADGIEHAEEVGFDVLLDRGREAVADLTHAVVHAGMSLGVLPAQMLAQTMDGARGAVLLHGCIPPEEFETPWPQGLRVQVHTMTDDDLGDVDVARGLAATVPTAEVFEYPGDAHLFTDRGTADHDPAAAALVLERVIAFLAALDETV
ncbi:MAG: dienelactone hydrolase family protein [Actinobacteria bacterium]|nr:dienelactone hydrolase family protein [Actinomycetota bacterium]